MKRGRYNKYPRSSYYKKRASSSSLCATVRKCQIKEIKAVDLLNNAGGVGMNIGNETTNVNVELLNGVQQGAGANQRLGRYVKWVGWHLKGTIVPSYVLANATTFQTTIVMALVWDTQVSGGAIPPITDIFQDLSEASGTSTTQFAGQNLANKDRFKILFQKRFVMPPNATVAPLTNQGSFSVDSSVVSVNIYIKGKGHRSTFISTANPMTTANFSSGCLYLVMYNQGGNAKATAAYGFTYAVRSRYSDD